jgi:hypothetical protein
MSFNIPESTFYKNRPTGQYMRKIVYKINYLLSRSRFAELFNPIHLTATNATDLLLPHTLP